MQIIAFGIFSHLDVFLFLESLLSEPIAAQEICLQGHEGIVS